MQQALSQLADDVAQCAGFANMKIDIDDFTALSPILNRTIGDLSADRPHVCTLLCSLACTLLWSADTAQ